MAAKALTTAHHLGSLALKNRVVLAPLTRGRAGDEHIVGREQAVYYSQRASAGLLITEATGVSRQGLGWDGAPGLWSAEQTEAWKPVTAAVHDAGSVIFAQLWHMGRVSHSDFFGLQPISASAIKADGYTHVRGNIKKDYETPRAATLEDIAQIIEEFRNAAANAKAAGFDGVEIHGANGYLVDQFLQSVSNVREDAYGGSVENRFRLLHEIVEAIATVYDRERIGVRLSPNGMYNSMGSEDNFDSYQYIIRRLNEAGIGYVHVMDGLAFGFHQKCAAFTLAEARANFPRTIIANCGYTEETAEAAVKSGNADLVAFGRPFLANPDLALRIANSWPLAADPAYNLFYRQYPDDNREVGYIDFPFYQATA